MLSLLRRRGAHRQRDNRGQDHLHLERPYREFPRRRDGLCFALDGGVWLHRHRLKDEPMAHLVSADRERLVAVGQTLGLRPEWLQYKPLKDPRSGRRIPAWHWDVWGSRLAALDTGASR